MTSENIPSLFKKVIKGAGWVFVGKFFGRLVELIKSVVLARLLSPEQFGVFGLVMIVVIMIDTFSQTGMRPALLQHKGNTVDYVDTAWSIQVLRGICIALIVFAIAPFVSWIYNEPQIVPMLRVICFAPLIQGFVNIRTVFFDKELDFKKQLIIDITSSSISLLAGIILAYLYHSVWALVIANIAMGLTQLICSYLLSPCNPRFKINKVYAVELFQFGRWMSGYTMALFVCQQVDKIIIAKIMGPLALGYYQIAQRLSELPVANIAISSISFTFPAYSKMQFDQVRLKKAFLDTFEAILSLVFPVALFMIFAANNIVEVLLGSKWVSAVLPFQILSVAGMITAVDVLTTPVFMSLGKPNIEFYKNIVRGVALIILVIPFTKTWGITGSCIAVTISVLTVHAFLFKLTEITDVKFIELFRCVAISLLIGMTATFGIWASSVLAMKSNILTLFISFILGTGSYLVASYLSGKYFDVGIYNVFKRVMNNRPN